MIDVRQLIGAALRGDCDGIRAITAAGVAASAAGPNGMTALMAAARNNHVDAVRLLLSLGADPRAVSGERRTALNYAWNPEILRLLLDAGGTYEPIMPQAYLKYRVDPSSIRFSADATPEFLRDWQALVETLAPLHELWRFETPRSDLRGANGYAVVYRGIPVRQIVTFRA